MKIEFENSFNRDLKKTSLAMIVELDEILNSIESANSLFEIPYSIKKMEGFPKLKVFRLKPKQNRFLFRW